MATTILITGATGTIGSKVIAALAEAREVKVRAAARGAERSRLPANATPVELDYERPDTIAAAVRGADKVFLLTPFVQNPVPLGKRLIDAAREARVEHVVKLSAFGCEIEPGITFGRQHRAVEKALEASGMGWTFLRPNNFMDNFLGYYPPDAQGNIVLPWGSGACSFIDARDVAAVAAAALTREGHAGKAYTLTGPEAITIAQAADTIAEVTGRTIKYIDVPEDAAKKAMIGHGAPAWMAEAMGELNAIDKAGYAAAVTPAVKEITGRSPRSFAEFARDYAARWRTS
jgi:uncharacterized protein YbjT (DUF2867 family)